jgi:hypothetical protein
MDSYRTEAFGLISITTFIHLLETYFKRSLQLGNQNLAIPPNHSTLYLAPPSLEHYRKVNHGGDEEISHWVFLGLAAVGMRKHRWWIA